MGTRVSTTPFDARGAVAAAVRAHRAAVAEQATEAFLANHPDMLARLGERARDFGREDAGYHVDFLAAAVESGAVEAFADYIRWAVRVLASRGLPGSMVQENLRQIEQAYTPLVTAEVAATLAPYFEQGIAAAGAPPVPVRRRDPAAALAATQRIYLDRVLAGDRRAAAAVAREAVIQGHPLLDIYVDVLQTTLYEVGAMWESNQISVAQEHTATAVCQYVLAELYNRMPPPETRRGRAIVTGVEGEYHQVGANLIADARESDGWDVRFLGVNTPRAGVLQALSEHKPDALGVSVTMLFNVAMARRLIGEARERMGAKLTVIAGGAAFRAAPNLWREIGADHHAPDVRAAVETMRTLG